MWQYLVNIWESLKTPLIGMRLTWKRLFVPAVTLQYPEERWELPPNSRMQLFVNMDDCIGCVQCERACPVQCWPGSGLRCHRQSRWSPLPTALARWGRLRTQPG